VATLTSAIGADDELVRVTGGSAAVAGKKYRAGDEVIVFRGFQRYPTPWSAEDPTRWYIERGADGSTPASQSGGTTLYGINAEPVVTGGGFDVPAPFPSGGSGLSSITGTGGGSVSNPTALQVPGTVADLGGGVAGVGLVCSLIGPFPVAFDSPGLAVDGFQLCDLVAGTVIVSVGIFVTAQWNNGADQLFIEFGGSDFGPPDDDYGAIAIIDPSARGLRKGSVGESATLSST